jgi:hypothetical protein
MWEMTISPNFYFFGLVKMKILESVVLAEGQTMELV